MSIFNRKRKIDNNSEELQERLDGGEYGIHFPWIGVIFLLIGIASEVTDAFLLQDALGSVASSLGDDKIALISGITGLVCFGSMAAIGYQSANTKVKYRTKALEIIIWLAVGIFIASLRVFLAIQEEGLDSFVSIIFNQNAIMGGLQLLLYIGSGFMTYSSAKQLTNGKLYEYLMARYEYNNLIDEIADKRDIIEDGIQKLSLYPEYAERLKESRKGVSKNVGQYNKATRALCEAKMAIVTDPDQMDEMYEDAKDKEIRESKRWSDTE